LVIYMMIIMSTPLPGAAAECVPEIGDYKEKQ
jgi:hypothetical protein